MAAAEPIRDKKQLKEFAEYWKVRGNYRNHTLIVLGVCTALRISDLLRLMWEDVYDERNGAYRSHITVTEQKTGKHKIIALNKQAVKALGLLFPHRHGVYLFSNNRKSEKAIGRVQAWRIIKEAAKAVQLAGSVACHSLRKTFGYHAWVNGISPVVLMDIFNHSSYEITRRYLGVSQDDRDKVYRSLEFF